MGVCRSTAEECIAVYSISKGGAEMCRQFRCTDSFNHIMGICEGLLDGCRAAPKFVFPSIEVSGRLQWTKFGKYCMGACKGRLAGCRAFQNIGKSTSVPHGQIQSRYYHKRLL